MTAMIWVQSREMEPKPNYGSYLLKPTWNYMWSGSGPGPVKPETKSSLAIVPQHTWKRDLSPMAN